MLLSDLVRVSGEVAATRSRLTKTAAIAEALRTAEPDEVEVVAAYLAGAPRQRRTGVGWRGLAQLPDPAVASSLTVSEVDAALERISTLSGAGSQAARAAAVVELFGRATAEEQAFLRALIFENLRQGALDSLLLDAIAKAAEVPPAAVRRAAMFSAASGPIAAAALSGGEEALLSFSMVVGRPVRPMLASPATSMDDAVTKLPAGTFAADAKLDGIRIQVHRDADAVAIFTRSLDDITDRLPEVVEAVLALDLRAVVLDGEAIALRPDGRPRPFQETASRTGSTASLEVLRESVPVTPYFFDVLHLDGEDLIDSPAAQRFDRLATALPGHLLVPRIVTNDAAEASGFFGEIVAQGHEGVVVKDLSSTYDAGRRGSAWLKVKPRHTLDLVVLAVEWGSGRREGWLSNIHLGARGPDGGFVMLGKTFKGMTDEMLDWQTKRFLELETSRSRHVVHVRPEQVVEIAFDGVQRSSRYPGGMALRFARVLRYRDDKTADEADTIDRVRALHDAGLA